MESLKELRALLMKAQECCDRCCEECDMEDEDEDEEEEEKPMGKMMRMAKSMPEIKSQPLK